MNERAWTIPQVIIACGLAAIVGVCLGVAGYLLLPYAWFAWLTALLLGVLAVLTPLVAAALARQ